MSAGIRDIFCVYAGGVGGVPDDPRERRIKLTVSTPERVRFKGEDTFRVRIVASDGFKLPNEVFGHQRTLVDPITGQSCDEFVFVCSAFDISIYPANEPALTQSPQFFRKDTMDILVPGVGCADDVINDVEAQVCRLVQVLNRLDTLQDVQEVWCPGPPDVEDSDSSDSSFGSESSESP